MFHRTLNVINDGAKFETYVRAHSPRSGPADTVKVARHNPKSDRKKVAPRVIRQTRRFSVYEKRGEERIGPGNRGFTPNRANFREFIIPDRKQ